MSFVTQTNIEDAVAADAVAAVDLADSRFRGAKLKRAFDLGVSLVMLLILLPVFVVLACAVRLDGGPCLFRHKRLGKGGRIFMCYKFRTMRQDSNDLLEAVLRQDPVARLEWEATQKLRNDPRVTPIGRFLRQTSLDELPQLLNVLFNDMSLVGPRPITPQECARYGSSLRYYYSVQPGITGLWQVSGRSTTSYERRVELDTEYVSSWSLRADLRILYLTIPAVLLRRGAC
jgi:Undecaprenyl-phosphate galactose phosphotransferase WbaP